MTEKKNNTKVANDWLDINFFGNFLFRDHQIKDVLNDRKHRINQEVISHRVLNSWYKHDLVEDGRPNGKGWAKFSYSEIVWIHIVIKLRRFGLDIPKIKKVKETLSQYSSEESKSKWPLFDFFLIQAKSQSEPIKLLVFESAESELLRQTDIDFYTQFGFISEDYISIDLNKLQQKIGPSDKGEETNYSSYQHSDISKEALLTLNDEDIKRVEITSTNNSFLFDAEYFTNNKERAEKLAEMIEFSSFTTVKYKNKKSYKATTQKKFKKRANP